MESFTQVILFTDRDGRARFREESVPLGHGTPQALLYMVEQLPPDASWTVAGIGSAQLPLGTLAILLGGHVRVGFEDNVYYRKGELASSNAQLVARIARISEELNRPVATPAQARAMLGLTQS